jgi:hypothetical protein
MEAPRLHTRNTHREIGEREARRRGFGLIFFETPPSFPFKILVFFFLPYYTSSLFVHLLLLLLAVHIQQLCVCSLCVFFGGSACKTRKKRKKK